MYYSKHNEKIVYINHYSGLLEVEGEGLLLKEDAEVWPSERPGWQKKYDTLSITEGITGLAEGYLDAFSHIECLILARTVESIAAAKELEDGLRKNKVLVRGEYDTFAERFAKEKGLSFLHCDIPLAEDDIGEHYEHDVITLRFHTNASPDIHYNCFTPGSSAGSYGGGEYAVSLPKDFYLGCSLKEFTSRFPERIHAQLMANDMLRRFLDAANSRKERR